MNTEQGSFFFTEWLHSPGGVLLDRDNERNQTPGPKSRRSTLPPISGN